MTTLPGPASVPAALPDPYQPLARALIAAMAHPLRVHSLPAPAGAPPPPTGVPASAWWTLLALADDQTPIHGLPQSLEIAPGQQWLARTDRPAEASFALSDGARVALDDYNPGTALVPEGAATVLIAVTTLGQAGRGAVVTLTGEGPGIETSVGLTVAGLSIDFPRQWRRNHERFPCGVDVLLCCGEQVAAMPRSLRLL